MEEDEHAVHDHETATKVMMESIDDAEKWMNPWLMFNENRMKQVGLEKLEIEWTCDLQPDYEDIAAVLLQDGFESIFNEQCDKCIENRVSHRNECGRQGIRAGKYKKHGYRVSLSLQSV